MQTKQSTTDGCYKEQSSNYAVLKEVPEVEHYVLDGYEIRWYLMVTLEDYTQRTLVIRDGAKIEQV